MESNNQTFLYFKANRLQWRQKLSETEGALIRKISKIQLRRPKTILLLKTLTLYSTYNSELALSIIYQSSSDHTFGTPNPGYPRDILDESSTNVICNGSEMHGYTCPKPRYILRKLQKPGQPDILQGDEKVQFSTYFVHQVFVN